MARVVSTSTYRAPARASTLRALQERQDALLRQQGEIAKPREIRSPWQGVAQMAEAFVNARQQAHAETQEAEGRQRLAEIRAGIDLSKGPTSEQIAAASELDPDYAARLEAEAMQARREDLRYQRSRADTLADIQSNRAFQTETAARTREQELADAARTRQERLADTATTRQQQLADAATERQQRLDDLATAREQELADAAAAGKSEQEKLEIQHRYRVEEEKVKTEANRQETRPPTEAERKEWGLLPGRPYQMTRKPGEGWKPEGIEGGGSGQQINIGDQVAIRKQQAEALGLKPDDPRYQPYILTGTMQAPAKPKELTATDRKAIQEADDQAQASENVIGLLGQALDLNENTYEGVMAGQRASVGSIFGGDEAERTLELQNITTKQAFEQLKSVFGAAPTEGERKALVEVEGSVNLPANVRKGIYERAIALAQKRLAFNRDRAEEIRSGTYYLPEDQRNAGGGEATAGGLPDGVSEEDIQETMRANNMTREQVLQRLKGQ